MHFRSVFYTLGSLLVLLGVVMVIPALTAASIDDGVPLEQYELLAFIGSIAAAVIIGLGMRTVCVTDLSRLGHREGAAIVSLTWIVFSLIGCLPYVITGAAGLTDAFFETMSGFTTTGATIFTDIEALPSGIQLWRHLTQWIGGMGIVVLSVAILPILGVGGYRMFKAETPGGSTFQRNAPRIKETARVLWGMYLGMSVVEFSLLVFGGMSLYDAVCHTFTTMSTGGFSTSGKSMAGWPSPMIQWTVIGFMLLAGCNFSIYQQLIQGPRRAILKDPELRLFLTIVAVVGGLHIFVLLRANAVEGGVEPTVRAAIFTVTSVTTTTGYGTEDFNNWPNTLRLALVFLMFVGGCAGSTAGGMKVSRLLIFAKSSVTELRRSINPRAVLVVRIGNRPLGREVVGNIMSFLAMWVILFALVTYILTLLGLDLLSATTAAATNLGNVGPGLGSVGPTANFAQVPLLGKWLLVLCMLLGRLELYSTLVLFLPQTWVR